MVFSYKTVDLNQRPNFSIMDIFKSALRLFNLYPLVNQAAFSFSALGAEGAQPLTLEIIVIHLLKLLWFFVVWLKKSGIL